MKKLRPLQNFQFSPRVLLHTCFPPGSSFYGHPDAFAFISEVSLLSAQPGIGYTEHGFFRSVEHMDEGGPRIHSIRPYTKEALDLKRAIEDAPESIYVDEELISKDFREEGEALNPLWP
jgi:hypothetical protein